MIAKEHDTYDLQRKKIEGRHLFLVYNCLIFYLSLSGRIVDFSQGFDLIFLSLLLRFSNIKSKILYLLNP